MITLSRYIKTFFDNDIERFANHNLLSISEAEKLLHDNCTVEIMNENTFEVILYQPIQQLARNDRPAYLLEIGNQTVWAEIIWSDSGGFQMWLGLKYFTIDIGHIPDQADCQALLNAKVEQYGAERLLKKIQAGLDDD